MTSISTEKVAVLFVLLFFLIGAVSASYYYSDEGSSYSVGGDTGFSIPEYESQSELLTQLAAPFILLFMIFQIGFERALRFAFADNNHTPLQLQKNKNPPGIKRKSIMMALAVSGMLVPTPFFRNLDKITAVIFGGTIVLIYAAIGLVMLWGLTKIFF